MERIDYSDYTDTVSDIVARNLGGCASVPSILADWSTNKYDLYKRFGNKTIVRTEEINIAIDDRYTIEKTMRRFSHKVRMMLGDLDEKKRNMIHSFLDYGYRTEGFKNNIVDSNWDSSNVEHRMGLKTHGSNYKPEVCINEGAKLSKSFKKFFDIDGDDGEAQQDLLKDIQSLYSQYRQTLATQKKGRLYLSIDPYDYLSISDNNHNWSSCHSMLDGEYRIGNLNYMADATTVVGYYCSDDSLEEEMDTFGEHKKWNSKRWRVLIHMEVVNGKLIAAYNRQYPFVSDPMITKLDEFLASFCEDLSPSTFVTAPEYNGEFLTRGYDCCQYSDFRYGDSNCYIRADNDFLTGALTPTNVIVGQAVLCIECGNHITTREESGHCDYCSNEYYCEECDGMYQEEDMVYLEDEDRYICYSCEERRMAVCGACGDAVGDANLRYAPHLQQEVCNSCAEDLSTTDTTYIYVFNSAGREVNKDASNKEELKKIYADVWSEATAEKERVSREHSDNVFTTNVLMHIGNESASDLRWFQQSIAGEGHYNSVSMYRYDRPPFVDLGFSNDTVGVVQEIIFLGALTEAELAYYINDAIDLLKSLNEFDAVLDYSKVRVI